MKKKIIMKELSIEEKAKAYDKAIEKAKGEYAKFEGMLPGDVLEEVFPELKESNDERTRKWLIEMVEEVRKANPSNADHNGNCSEAIAWLEKQGEQKPTDLGTWKCIVDAVVSEREGEAVEGIIDGDDFIIRKKEGIGQNIDSSWVTEVAEKLQKRFGSIKQEPVEYAKGEDHDIDGLWTALDILHKTLGKVKGYQSDDGILEHECAISAVEKLYYEEPIGFDLTD